MDQERFENFEILRTDDGRLWELGRGGMGVTYKARDTDLHRYAALKIIHPAIVENTDARERFLREARAAARLQHPNIAGIMRLGRATDGSHFYAMDFCDGPTLEAAAAARGALPPAEAAEIARQVCSALVAAESHGIVHRDLKPSNLILTERQGEGLVVKVIDFGLAKAVDDMHQTLATAGSGGFSGTAHFASPEQLEELPVDTRSDLYSLGACLWFMLTGRPVFEGSLARVMSQALSAEPAWEKLDGQPEVLIALLSRLLAKSPDGRPSSAFALKAELDQITANLGPVSASSFKAASTSVSRPPSTRSSVPKPVSSKRGSRENAESSTMTPGDFSLRFPILESIGRDTLGSLVRGTDIQRGNVPVRVLSIDPILTAVPAVRREILLRLTAAMAAPHESLLMPLAYTEDADGIIAAFDWFDGETLMQWLQRSRGRLAPAEVVSVLEVLAGVADHVAVHGLAVTSFAKQDVLIARRRGTDRPTIKVPVLSAGTLGGAGSAQATLFSMATRAPSNSASVAVAGCPPATVLARLTCELLGGHVDGNGRIAPLPSLSEAGNNVLTRACQPNAAQEFPTAAAFVSAWTAALGTAARIARPLPQTTAAIRKTPVSVNSKWSAQTKLGALAAGLAVLGTAWYFGLHKPREDARSDREARSEREMPSPKPPVPDPALSAKRAEMEKKPAELEKNGSASQAEADALKKQLAAMSVPARAVPVPEPNGKGFTNTLGMKFVPVPGTTVQFCIHETRSKDFAAFIADRNRGYTMTGSNADDWRTDKYKEVPAGRGASEAAENSDHPVANVSWLDAVAFCEWLSKKEGKTYRLPTDREWSVAVGISQEAAGTPKALDGGIKDVYPWGGAYVAPGISGNYSDATYAKLGVIRTIGIKGYNDGFATTAPVMSFTANQHGLYDMGGNLWEWVAGCYDGTDPQGKNKTLTNIRAMRGGCWIDDAPAALISSSRSRVEPGDRSIFTGFRVVVAGADGSLVPLPSTPQPSPEINNTARLESFADKTIGDEQSKDIQRILTNYSNRVDYFKDGNIDLAGIRKDKERYFSKWTNVTYKRVSPVKVTELNRNQWQLEFTTAFDHYKADGTRSAGIAKQTMHIALEYGAFKINYERGEVINPGPTAQSPVAKPLAPENPFTGKWITTHTDNTGGSNMTMTRSLGLTGDTGTWETAKSESIDPKQKGGWLSRVPPSLRKTGDPYRWTVRQSVRVLKRTPTSVSIRISREINLISSSPKSVPRNEWLEYFRAQNFFPGNLTAEFSLDQNGSLVQQDGADPIPPMRRVGK